MTVPLVQDPAPVSTGPYGAMVDAEAAAIAQVQQQLTTAVLALWASFAAEAAFWSGESVARLATRSAGLVVAAQRQVGMITETYLRQQFRQMGEPIPAGRIVDLPRDLRLGTEVEEVYQRPVRQVRYLVSEDRELAEAVSIAQKRLERALDLDVQDAHVSASQQVMYAQPDAKVVGYRRIIHPELGNVCGLCIAAADRVYSRIEKMSLHPGCVAEGSLVSASGVRALTRRRYAGPLVVLRTASGQKLRVTPNHPVLTDQGWVRADRLQQGDRVVRGGRGQRPGGRRPDEQQQPARVEDVWRSVTVLGGLLPRAVPLAPEHLHGDGGEGEVDVVLVDRLLAAVGGVSFVQPRRELSLVGAHGGRSRLTAASPLDLLLVRLTSAARSGVRSFEELQTLIAGELRLAQQGGFSASAGGYFSAPEDAVDHRAGYAEVGGKLLDRLAGEVELDDVVSLEIIKDWSGHVFNLETEEGWYSSDSIVVSNCKCTTLPVVEGADPGKELNAEDLIRLYDAAGGTGGRQLAQIRVVVRENGELGPILMPDGTEYRKADDVVDLLSPRAQEQRRNSINRQIEALEAVENKTEWLEDRLAKLRELQAGA